MIQIGDYLEGVLYDSILLVRGAADRTNSSFYSYMFSQTTEKSDCSKIVLVHNVELNSGNSGISKDYRYLITISDPDSLNMRKIGAKYLACDHFWCDADGFMCTVPFERWKREGSNEPA